MLFTPLEMQYLDVDGLGDGVLLGQLPLFWAADGRRVFIFFLQCLLKLLLQPHISQRMGPGRAQTQGAKVVEDRYCHPSLSSPQHGKS